jgi:hypothetical protein
MNPNHETTDRQLAEIDKPIMTRGQVIVFSITFLLLWAMPGLVILCGKTDVNKSGPFGDTFGTVNALFSGAAFAGIIFTILLQKRELRLQRYELELTRRELQRSASAQEKSEKALGIQASSLLLAAQINAVTSRIEAYNFQIEDTQGKNEYLNQQLRGERRSMVVELDYLLQRSKNLASD